MEGFLIGIIVWWILNTVIVIYKKGTGKPFVLQPSWGTVVMYTIGIVIALRALTAWI